MAYSNYPGGFKSGITIRGLPIELTHPGRVFWVGNSSTRLENEKTAADGNDGSFLAPFLTLEGALNNSALVGGRGDVLFVRPGFTLTIGTATALNFDEAGVAIIGLGSGSNRPTITYGTATTATIPVSVANVAIRNFLFIGNFDNIASVFTLTAATDFSVEDCEFRDNSASLGFGNLIDTSTVANAADGLYFARNKWSGLDTGATDVPFNVDATQARWQILNNYFHTDAIPTTLGMIDCAADAGLTEMRVEDNIYRHAGTDVTYGVIIGAVGVSTATGIIVDNMVSTLSAAASAAITVAAAGSGIWRLRNSVRPTQAAALRPVLLDEIAQAALVSA